MTLLKDIVKTRLVLLVSDDDPGEVLSSLCMPKSQFEMSRDGSEVDRLWQPGQVGDNLIVGHRLSHCEGYNISALTSL